MKDVYKIIGLSMIALVALLLLAGCSEGGGSSSLRSRINGAQAAGTVAPRPTQVSSQSPTETPDFGNAQPAMTAPTIAPTPEPQIIYQQVQQLATVIVRETVEVPVERVVVVTATPAVRATNGVTGYADSSVCDMSQPQPTPRVGDVDHVIGCVSAWETAVVASHGGK